MSGYVRHRRRTSLTCPPLSSLNDDYIVFRGGEHESASAHLKGTLVLCLSEPLAIKHIRLELTGMSRVWYVRFLWLSLAILKLTQLQLALAV